MTSTGAKSAYRTLYVGKSGAPVWADAEKLAAKNSMSLSRYITFLLRRESWNTQFDRVARGKPGVEPPAKPPTVRELIAEIQRLSGELEQALDREAAEAAS